MATPIKLDSTGFSKMIGHLKRGTGASLKDVTRAMTGRVLQNAAVNTGKSKYAKIKKDVERSLGRTFVSSVGVKVRKAKDGSLIVKGPSVTNNKWIRVRRKFELNAISGKNPSGTSFTSNQTTKINKALGEIRKRKSAMLKEKKKNIASGQATFIFMMKKLRIPLKSSKGLGDANKHKLSMAHASAVSAKENQSTKEQYLITLMSKSNAALNPYARGIDGFRKAFNGQIKSFKIASQKDMKAYAKKFASQNGFVVR